MAGMTSPIKVSLPDAVVTSLDATAAKLRRSREEVIRQAVEHYLDDVDDLAVASERLRDPNDPVLDWDHVRRETLGADSA